MEKEASAVVGSGAVLFPQMMVLRRVVRLLDEARRADSPELVALEAMVQLIKVERVPP